MSLPVAPAIAARCGVASTASGLRFAVLATPLVGVTFLSKFTVPPLGEQGIDLSLLFLLAALLVGSVGGCIRFEPRRLTLYVMLIGILGIMQMLQPDLFSFSSMLLLVALHLPYVFTVPQAMMASASSNSFLGSSPFLRAAALRNTAFNSSSMRAFCSPSRILSPTLSSSSTSTSRRLWRTARSVYRANGVFLLEPSFFSQVLAVAIVAELCTLRQGDPARRLRARAGRFVFRHRNAGAGDLPAVVRRHAAPLGSAAARRYPHWS